MPEKFIYLYEVVAMESKFRGRSISVVIPVFHERNAEQRDVPAILNAIKAILALT